ncbi:RING finger protein 208-like [Solea senegalensis]|uniref:RING finger protein 208-like n=1 Tax=Solea senegalensis TaxID=28829 RepID=A0AAV6QPY2_SOLSE|nr:RING finger protein 208-like [Solea senegalensis]
MSSQNLTAVDQVDLECIVCCHEFYRRSHVPLLLNCKHTFCVHCLQKISKQMDCICTICCPLCRWITCIQAGKDLDRVLDLDYKIWEQIPEEKPRRMDNKVSDPWSGSMSTVKTRWPRVGRITSRQHFGMRKLSCVFPV